MATASDLLFGLQTEYSICLEFTGLGTVYVDRYPVGGGDVKDRLTAGLIYTYGIPAQPFGVSQRSSLGSIKAAHTELAPLTDELNTDFKGEEYKVSVCGVINQGLFDEEVITFDNRVDYVTGICGGSTCGENSFLWSLGDGDAYYSQNILDQIVTNGDEVTASQFDFSLISATNARDTGTIQTDVTPSTLSSGSQTIDITFGDTITDLDITLERAGSDVPLKTFTYADVSSTKVSSTGEIVSDIEISATTGTPITVTLTFTPSDSTKWMIRDIDVESISNWSVAPDNIGAATFGDAINTELVWTGLNGVNQITFDLNKTSGDVVSISVPPDDPQTRPHIFGGSTSVKIWPLEIVQSIPLPTGIGWTVAPDATPPTGVVGTYAWINESFSTLDFTATFPDVGGSNPNLALTCEGNKVTLSNGLSGVRFSFERVFKDPAGDPNKIAYAPYLVGKFVNNYSPFFRGINSAQGYSEYTMGSGTFTSVRDAGSPVPNALNSTNFLNNNTNGIVSFYQPIPGGTLIQVSGSPSEITLNGYRGDYGLSDPVEDLAALVGIDPADIVISSDISLLSVAHYYTEQQNFKTALDALLSPLDICHFFRNGILYVQRRKTFTMSNFDSTLDASGVSQLKRGIENPRIWRINVYYSKNWTVQSEVTAYKSEYELIQVEDSATQSIPGSIERTTYTSAVFAGGANIVAETLNRDKRRNMPLSFYYDSRKGEIIPNTRIRIPESVLGGSMYDGMFLPTKVQINTDKRTQYVEGTWYAN